MTELRKEIGLNSFQLKWIAIITMVIDHIGAVLHPAGCQLLLRQIGRLSFPIFCFLLVEGFFYTRDVHRYLVRLGIFAFVSEIPFDLAFHGKVFYFEKQNVFFTLFLGLMLLYLLQLAVEWPERIMEMILVAWLAWILKSDYSYKGIVLIVGFYYLREHLWPKLIYGGVWNFIWNRSIQKFGAFAMIPIGFYNGERGPKMKYFFYLFYPLHLLVLYGIGRL